MAFVSHLVKSCYPVRRVVTDRLVCRRTLWSIREGIPCTSFFEASTFTGSKFSPFWSPLALQEIQRKRPSSGCRLFCTSSNISKEASRFVEEAVEKDSVVVFAKSWCPYCARVKGLFQSLQVPFKAYDLDQVCCILFSCPYALYIGIDGYWRSYSGGFVGKDRPENSPECVYFEATYWRL